MDDVVELHLDVVVNVFERDRELIGFRLMGHVVQDQIAIAIGARDFERRLIEAWPTPAGILFVFEHLVRIERRNVSFSFGCRYILDTPQRPAPVQVLQLVFGRQTHRIGTRMRRQQPDVTAGVVANALRRSAQRQQHHKNQPAHISSLMFKIRFAVSRSSTWRFPPGQRISIRSTMRASPKPKCSRKSFCER